MAAVTFMKPAICWIIAALHKTHKQVSTGNHRTIVVTGDRNEGDDNSNDVAIQAPCTSAQANAKHEDEKGAPKPSPKYEI